MDVKQVISKAEMMVALQKLKELDVDISGVKFKKGAALTEPRKIQFLKLMATKVFGENVEIYRDERDSRRFMIKDDRFGGYKKSLSKIPAEIRGEIDLQSEEEKSGVSFILRSYISLFEAFMHIDSLRKGEKPKKKTKERELSLAEMMNERAKKGAS